MDNEIVIAGKSYKELQLKISEECNKHGYKFCDRCPLVHACSAERDIENGETQTEFTKRWEQAMAEEFAKQFPDKV